MKKLFIAIAAIAALTLTSCEKMEGDTTYTLTDHEGLYELAVSESQGLFEVEYTYFIYEYTKEGLRINTNTVDKPQKGKAYKFTAKEDAYYVTVKWQLSLISDIKEVSKITYLPNVILLEKGANVDIDIDGNTYFQKTEPK